MAGRWSGLAADVDVRFVSASGWDGMRPPLASAGSWIPGGPPEEAEWRGVGADQRWAMELLGLRAGMPIVRDDVNRRFRRFLRDAHPDSGGKPTAAAARIEELTEARAILLAVASEDIAAEG